MSNCDCIDDFGHLNHIRKNAEVENLFVQIKDLFLKTNSVNDVLERAKKRYQYSLDLLHTGAPIYIWGAKGAGLILLRSMLNAGYNDIKLIDNNSELQGKFILNTEIISPNHIDDSDKAVFIVGSLPRLGDIYLEMKKNGYNNILPSYAIDIFCEGINLEGAGIFGKNHFLSLAQHSISNKNEYLRLVINFSDEESIITLLRHIMFRLTFDMEFLCNIQSLGKTYFDSNLITLNDHECFIDGGGYKGDTLKLFLKESQLNFKSYYLFEPDINLINEAKLITNDLRVKFINKGLYSKKGILKYNKTGDGTGSISSNGESEITTCCLDEEVTEKVSFIKLDIEGAELEALKGSKKHITEDLPVLCISIYHRAEDFITISEYILGLVPKYRLYLRSYLNSVDETVLYAIPTMKLISKSL